MAEHIKDIIPDPFAVASNAKDECLATALKACVLLVAYDDSRKPVLDFAKRVPDYAVAVDAARKAVELWGKIK